jgi:hypothetical protein
MFDRGATQAMTLIDLLDLEAQLARDREMNPPALEARDRMLLAGGGAPFKRDALIHRWLVALRERDPGAFFPGSAVASALSWLRALLAIAGAALGWGAATAVLHYTGDSPVNIWDFLLGFVGLQLLLLALLVVTFLIPMAAFGAPVFGVLRGLFRSVYSRLAARAAGEKAEQWRALWHRLRMRRSLYHRVEPWLLLGLTQTLGVAFNAGALLALARLVVFSDIAFSWSTTLLQLDAQRFHALVTFLAAPFGWAFPEAVPSAVLVEATRFSRLEGAYVGAMAAGRAASPGMVGGWWPFLTAALVFYGLGPRLLVLGLSRAATSWVLSRLPLDDVEVSRLVQRLAEPHVETRSPAPEAPAGSQVPSRPMSAPVAFAPPPGARCAVVLWRDLPNGPELQAALSRKAGLEVAEVHTAGGVDFEEGAGDWGVRLAGAERVELVAEGWEAPDGSVRRLIAELRRAAGPRRPLTVWLVDEAEGGVRPAPEVQLRLWRETLGRLEDPYLAVEPLGGGP